MFFYLKLKMQNSYVLVQYQKSLAALVDLSNSAAIIDIIYTWAIQKLTYFRQSVLNKILVPDVFDYGDCKSESWHRAKKIRKFFWPTNRLAHVFVLLKKSC